MKNQTRFYTFSLSFLLAGLIPLASLADGYRCEGQNFRVKVYNHTNPTLGTKNPAIMVVSHRKRGTIISLFGESLEKVMEKDAISYEGLGNSAENGRYLFANLKLLKDEGGDYELGDSFFGILELRASKRTSRIRLICERYLKNARDSFHN